MTTHAVFQSGKFLVATKANDYRYVHAKNPIKKGELLLAEHCYVSKDIKVIQHIVLASAELFDNLYPRKEKWTEQLLSAEGRTQDVWNLVLEKAQKNVFGIKESRFVVGLIISNFNHSTNPNASVKFTNYDIDETVSVFIPYVVADRNINIDEEITISYGKSYFGDDAPEFDNSLVITQADILVDRINRQYMRKQICLEMVVKHVSLFYGLYVLNHDLVCHTTRFIETFNMQPTLENVYKWMHEQAACYKKKLSAF